REHPLIHPREPGWIEERHEVVIEEAARVSGLARELAQMDLERRERADLPRDLHPEAPSESCRMDEYHPEPLQCEKAAKDDERGEGEVEGDGEIRQDPPAHQAPAGLWIAAASGALRDRAARGQNASDALHRLLERL